MNRAERRWYVTPTPYVVDKKGKSCAACGKWFAVGAEVLARPARHQYGGGKGRVYYCNRDCQDQHEAEFFGASSPGERFVAEFGRPLQGKDPR